MTEFGKNVIKFQNMYFLTEKTPVVLSKEASHDTSAISFHHNEKSTFNSRDSNFFCIDGFCRQFYPRRTNKEGKILRDERCTHV